MSKAIKEQYLVSGFLTLFLIHSVQVGVGMLGFQRTVVKEAGYDAWFSILLSGLSIHLIVACMYLLLKRSNGDLMSIHKQIFGKWLGKILSFFVALYFIGMTITVLRSYIEIVQVWVFPDLETWGITIIAVIFFYYVVSGGFRTVVGLAFFGVIIPIPLFLMLVLPLEFAQFINMLPILKHSINELLLGAKEATLSFLGAELLLLFYPFLKNREETQKWSQLGVLLTTITYLVIMVVSLAFYSQEQLNKTIWATLTLFKVVQLPFLERFEYIGISLWMFLIAPNIGVLLWAASRSAKIVFQMSQRKALIIALLLVGIGCMLLPSREEIKWFSNLTGELGFYFLYIYIPLLTILQTLVIKIRRNKHGQSTSL